jgi:centrosomal protein CEP164
MADTRNAGDVHVLSREEMTNHVCESEEIAEYAEFLGIDVELDRDLFWLAEQGLCTAPPEPWKACQAVGSTELFFFNFNTGESVWEHPCDDLFRQRIQEELQKRVLVPITLASTRLENGAWGIAGTNLAGDEVCRLQVAFEGAETFAGMEDLLRAQLKLSSGSVARFVLADATVLGHSHRQLKVKELFAALV